MAENCVLIDFATGENWLLPVWLYNQYNAKKADIQQSCPPHTKIIQYWISELNAEERAQVSLKSTKG